MYKGNYLINKVFYNGAYLMKSFYHKIRNLLAPCSDKLLHYSSEDGDGVGNDISSKGDERLSVNGKVFHQSGTTFLRFLDFPNTTIYYFDVVLGFEQSGITNGSGDFTIPSNDVSYFRIDTHYFTPESVLNPQTQDKITDSTGQLTAYAFNTTPTWVKDNYKQGVLDCDTYGYTIADGTTMYRDPNQTDLYDAGQPIPAIQQGDTYSKQYCRAYDGNGDLVPLDYVGRAKHMTESIDGLANDDLIGYDFDNPQFLLEGENIRVVGDGTLDNSLGSGNATIKPNTDYLIVLNVVEATVNANTNLGVIGFRGNAFQGAYPTGLLTIGENRFLRTSDASVLGEFGLLANSNMTASETVLISEATFYEVSDLPDPLNPLTSDLPTGYQDGNSLIARDSEGNPWSLIAQADDSEILTTNNGDGTASAKVVEISTLERNTNDQLFVDFDNGEITKIGFYKEPLIDPCLSEARVFFNTHLPFMVSDGQGGFQQFNVDDGNGGSEPFYVKNPKN